MLLHCGELAGPAIFVGLLRFWEDPSDVLTHLPRIISEFDLANREQREKNRAKRPKSPKLPIRRSRAVARKSLHLQAISKEKGQTDNSLAFFVWWSWRDLNPRP